MINETYKITDKYIKTPFHSPIKYDDMISLPPRRQIYGTSTDSHHKFKRRGVHEKDGKWYMVEFWYVNGIYKDYIGVKFLREIKFD